MPRKTTQVAVATEELSDQQLAALAANPKAFRAYLAKLAVASPAAPSEQVLASGDFGEIVVDRPPSEEEATIVAFALDPDLGRTGMGWACNAMQPTKYLKYFVRTKDGTTVHYARKGGKVGGYFMNQNKLAK